MSVELIPYSEFNSSRDLAIQLHEVVASNKPLLQERKLNGPIIRYGGSLRQGIEKVEKGQREHIAGELGHFAVVGDSGDVIGSASIYPDLMLRKLRLPVPPVLAFGRLAVGYPYATPNIHAWVADGEGDLTDVYKNLVKLSRDMKYRQRMNKPEFVNPWHVGSAWTVEPKSSPKEVHDAIKATTLSKVATRRFDQGESRLRVPPRGTLYAKIIGNWLSPRGEQKELRTGEKSFQDETYQDQASFNPRG